MTDLQVVSIIVWATIIALAAYKRGYDKGFRMGEKRARGS